MAVFKIHRGLVSSILVVFVLYAIHPMLVAQTTIPKSTIHVVLVNEAAVGLSEDQADSFLSNLKGKLSQFSTLGVFLKADLAKILNKEDRAALDKCSDLGCVQQCAAKGGFQRVLLIKFTKKNTTYQIQSREFDVRKPQKLSEINETALCATADDLEEFMRQAAVKIGQATAHVSSVPESLEKRNSNLWWYVGSAVAVGIAGGVYYYVSHKKETSSPPSSLPLPPDLP